MCAQLLSALGQSLSFSHPQACPCHLLVPAAVCLSYFKVPNRSLGQVMTHLFSPYPTNFQMGFKSGLWSCPFLAPEAPVAPQCWAFGLSLCPQDLLDRSQSSRLPVWTSRFGLLAEALLVHRSSCAWFLVLSHQVEYLQVREVHAKRGQRRPAATGPSPSQMSSLLASLGWGGAAEGMRGSCDPDLLGDRGSMLH